MINFEKTPYLSIVNEKEGFKSDKQIFRHAKKNLQFTYGSVDRQAFDAKYSSDGWLLRKVIALPLAVWSGTVKTTYHLAQAIFIGIPKTYWDGGQCLKAQSFHIARDFQESYGWLASIFNDQYGQFHVQESLFHKTCYDCSAPNARMPVKPDSLSPPNEYNRWITPEMETISLLDYKEEPIEGRKEWSQLFNLNQRLSYSDMSLDEFVAQADETMLKILSLKDWIIPLKYSKMRFAVNKQQFITLPIRYLQNCSADQFLFIKQRLEQIVQDNKADTCINYNNLTLQDLPRLTALTASEILQHQDNIPIEVFGLFTNDQILGLKLSEISEFKISALFLTLSHDDIKARLALFDKEDVVAAIHKGVDNENILNHLTVDHVRQLRLTKLNATQIRKIFYCESEDTVADRKRCFADFPIDDVQTALERGLLTSYDRPLILSEEQLKGVRLSNLSQATIDCMFSLFQKDKKAAKKQFALFSADDVQMALQLGKLTNYSQMNLISEEQLKGIQLSKLSQQTIALMFNNCEFIESERKRFAHFPINEVQVALELGLLTGCQREELLSEEHLRSIRLSALSQKTIARMFPVSSWSSCRHMNEVPERFALVPVEEVREAINKGLLDDFQQTRLLSDSQRSALALTEGTFPSHR